MYPLDISVMVLEKVLVAFFMPKGITIQLNNLNLVIKVIFFTFSNDIFIY